MAKAVFNFPSIFYAVNLGLQIKNREINTYWDKYLEYAKDRNIKLLSWNVWDKGNASAPAHQQAMYGLSHEWIFIFGDYKELNLTKENKGSVTWGKSTVREKDGSLSSSSGRTAGKKSRTHRQLDTIIQVTPVKNFSDEYNEHPAQFPVELAKQYVTSGTNQKDIVGEPFLGSGTTMIACEKEGRRCYGMEIDEHYMTIAIKRWEEYTGEKAVRL